MFTLPTKEHINTTSRLMKFEQGKFYLKHKSVKETKDISETLRNSFAMCTNSKQVNKITLPAEGL